MYIDIINNKLLIVFEYNPTIISIVRNFEGRIFNTKTKTWTVPIIHVVDVVNTLAPLGFKINDKVSKLYNDKNNKDLKIKQLLVGDIPQRKIDQVKQLQLPLFEFQQKGVYFLTEIQSAILADEPGLGKSIQSLATTLINQSISNLIVCPASLKLQWQEEIKKWIPSAITYVITGTKKQRLKMYQEAQKQTKLFYIIINYELILRDIDELSNF